MNIWGYSEEDLVADAEVIQRLESLLAKMERAAERDELVLQ